MAFDILIVFHVQPRSPTTGCLNFYPIICYRVTVMYMDTSLSEVPDDLSIMAMAFRPDIHGVLTHLDRTFACASGRSYNYLQIVLMRTLI